MSLRLYTGEYLISPYVLHFGLNWCTHACAYCFANANKPDRQAETSDLQKIVRWYDIGSDTAEFRLLKAGHPIMTANDSDPCAKSNYATFSILDDLSKSYGFRLVYQTRGGEPEAEARIVNGTPTSVYVSLTTDNDDIRKKMEPGAPSHDARMDFIGRLKKAGHHVIAGFNPFIPEWWDDMEKTMEQLSEAGIRHIWHQPLHLSRFQIENMRPSAKKTLGDKWISYGMAKREPDEYGYSQMLSAAAKNGINTIRGGVSDNLGFWDEYFSLGFPFVPTLDALVRDCDISAKNSGKLYAMFGIEAFNRWADFGMKNGSKCKEYLQPIGRSVRNAGERVEDAKSMAGVHEFLWRRESYPTRLRHSAFAHVSYDGGWASDEDGRPLIAVNAEGFRTNWPEVESSDCVFLETIERVSNGRE